MSVSRSKIEQAKEKLGDTARDIMVKEIPIEDWDGVKGKSIFREEDTPSMAWFHDRLVFKDFSSGQCMDYIDFAIKYHKLSFRGAVKELFDLVNFDYEESDFEEPNDNQHDVFKHFKFATDEPENNCETVIRYLNKRGISKATIDFCSVKQSEDKSVAYQFRDMHGKLIQTKYRLSRAFVKGYDKCKWWWQKGSQNCPLLYGVDKIDETKPLLIVEGLNDRLACVEAGYTNVVSINGGAQDFGWIQFNYDFLSRIKTLILWFDDDEIGQKSMLEVSKKLNVARTKLVHPDEEIKQKIREFYKGKEDKIDANNVLVAAGKNAVLKMINSASFPPNPKLKKLFDYDEVELYNLPRISTGFKLLDRKIMGNFDNTFTVISGWTGSGKSTLVAIMGIIMPMEAKKKVMVFSGEANGGTLLGSIMRPLAGRNHIIMEDNSAMGLPNYYRVTNEAKQAIKEYYRPLIWNYEDGESIKTTASDILDQMEYAYNRFGVQFFTLDNLMCISCSDNNSEKNSAQIDFAIALKKFTREHDVQVLLVAHPKKPAPGQKEVDTYGISGASEIPNLADRAFTVGTLDPAKEEGFNAYVKIMKDRQCGMANKVIKMYYDYATCRIYGDDIELNKVYSWEQNGNIFYPESIKNKLVSNIKINDGLNDILGTV